MTHAEHDEQAVRPRTAYKPRHAAPPLRASTLQKNPRILAEWGTPPASGPGGPDRKRSLVSWLRGPRGDEERPIEVSVG
jgi:hypothetical protein